MDKAKVLQNARGAAELSAGVILKLTEMGLSVSEVIFSGAKNLTNSFVKGPDLKIGESILGDIKKHTGKVADKLIKKGKGRF